MAFDVLQRAVEAGRLRRETSRQQAICRFEAALDRLAPDFGISEACLFGSIARSGRFTERSDVDLAARRLSRTCFE